METWNAVYRAATKGSLVRVLLVLLVTAPSSSLSEHDKAFAFCCLCSLFFFFFSSDSDNQFPIRIDSDRFIRTLEMPQV